MDYDMTDHDPGYDGQAVQDAAHKLAAYGFADLAQVVLGLAAIQGRTARELEQAVGRECNALCKDIEQDRDELTRKLEQARQQLAGVRALHRAENYLAGVKGCRACSDCCDTLILWPCATIRALDVAAEPCTATCPGLPFVACTYPVGHPPIPKDIRGAGWRDMDHGNDGKHQVWWNGSTAIVTGDAVALPADGRPASMLRAVEFATEPEPDAAPVAVEPADVQQDGAA